MKKHLYFFCSAIICILLSIYSIINSDKIINSVIESAKQLPSYMQDRVLDVYAKNGNAYIILTASICILISLLFIFFIVKKRVTKAKFIGLSIIGLFLSPIDLITYIFIW